MRESRRIVIRTASVDGFVIAHWLDGQDDASDKDPYLGIFSIRQHGNGSRKMRGRSR